MLVIHSPQRTTKSVVKTSCSFVPFVVKRGSCFYAVSQNKVIFHSLCSKPLFARNSKMTQQSKHSYWTIYGNILQWLGMAFFVLVITCPPFLSFLIKSTVPHIFPQFSFLDGVCFLLGLAFWMCIFPIGCTIVGQTMVACSRKKKQNVGEKENTLTGEPSP